MQAVLEFIGHPEMKTRIAELEKEVAELKAETYSSNTDGFKRQLRETWERACRAQREICRNTRPPSMPPLAEYQG